MEVSSAILAGAAGPSVPLGTFTFGTVSFAGLLVLLWLLGRRNNRRWQDWEYVLDASSRRKHGSFGEQFRWDREIIDRAYDDALAARQCSREDARRLLDLGYRFLVETSGERVRLLQRLASYTRMISLFVPPPPLLPRRFRLGRMQVLAFLAYLAHHFLVSAAERFQFRAYAIRVGFRIVVGSMLRSGRPVTASSPERAWAAIDAGREDFHTLSDETLETVRVFLLSLASAQQRGLAVSRA